MAINNNFAKSLLKNSDVGSDVSIATFKNKNNDCFIIAMLISLANTKLKPHLISMQTIAPISQAVVQIFHKIDQRKSEITVTSLRKHFHHMQDDFNFADNKQHDTFEFFSSLIHKLIEEENDYSHSNSIANLFEWKFNYKYFCSQCKNDFSTSDTQLYLPLNLPPHISPLSF